ncbi:MAG: FGGY family carbohydrate kinase [Acidimicrobiales bacterium]
MKALVVDVGTSSVRASMVDERGAIVAAARRPVLPSTPNPGFVEFDPKEMAEAALAVATEVSEEWGPAEVVGIANQRCSTVVWDRATGVPVGPGVSWQDLRTAGMCLALADRGVRVTPTNSATKLAFLLDMVDPDHQRDLCFGTVDSWMAWTLSAGSLHITDTTNAGVTGMMTLDGRGWDPEVLEALDVPQSVMPAIVDSSGIVGRAAALPGGPVIAGMAGDQQASMIGQGATLPGLGKLTFGTGGMCNICLGASRPSFDRKGPSGTFPIIAWRRNGQITWGLEAFMLHAGQAVEWLRDDLGMIGSAAESESVAAGCRTTDDVWFVPALLGMGTPAWDFGARGTLVGLTRGSGRAQVVRAVLEGVAHRGADLVEAAEADAGVSLDVLRVDGGMTANRVFVQALADATQRPVELGPVAEATTLGAAFLAGMAVGTWADEEELAGTWKPTQTIHPQRRPNRDRWRQACDRAKGWMPELSAVRF